ncbi:WD repeat-containing protein slp1 [Tilletia horrida]|uniref:WD repeat-containing protein slp1 n=1 Tax=Tilletia horrida TaxID=155126 RepID=A0AAN6GJD4_9BASI|nr:WD repeat-containing protein slp1 [Tilletia horrida]
MAASGQNRIRNNAGGTGRISPLGELNNLTLGGRGGAAGPSSPSKAGGLPSAAGRRTGVLSEKREHEDVIPGGGLSATDIYITKDFEGPVDSLKKSRGTSAALRGDRFISQRELSRSGGPTAMPLREDSGGERLFGQQAYSTAADSSGSDHTGTQSSIHSVNAIPTDLSGGKTELADACQLDMQLRIHSFTPAAPISSTAAAGQEARSRYAVSRPKAAAAALPTTLTSGGRRRIATTPEKILDAPGMLSDYYRNLLHWSSRNMLAIALGPAVWVWNAESGDVDMLCSLDDHEERFGGGSDVSSLRWDETGTVLAVGGERGHVQLWDIESGTRQRTLKPSPPDADEFGDGVGANVAAWSIDGMLNVGFESGLIREYDVRQRDAVTRNRAKAHGSQVCGLEWRADGQLLASGGNDNVVKVWDRRSTSFMFRKDNHNSAVKALSWCPWNNAILASGGGNQDRCIHFWNVTQSSRTHTIHTEGQVSSLNWSRDYREIVATNTALDDPAVGGFIDIYAHPSCNKVAEIKSAHEVKILHASLSPDGQTLATVGVDESLKFWKVFEKREDMVGGAGGKAGGTASMKPTTTVGRLLR